MNVTLAGVTVPSVASLELSPIVTSAVGWLFSTTVNVAVPPASVVSPLMAADCDPGGVVVQLVTANVGRVQAAVVRRPRWPRRP